MPPPLKFRDWCLLRTWRKTDDEFMIFNHSVEHNVSCCCYYILIKILFVVYKLALFSSSRSIDLKLCILFILCHYKKKNTLVMALLILRFEP